MDIELFYTDHGSENGKPPLILLHGNGGNASSFFYTVEHFSKTRRVITLDSRGHGRTSMGEKPFTLEQFADDVKDFMDEKGIEKAVLVGFSDGGNIAMLFARKYLDRVAGMVLNGANAFPSGLKEHFYVNMIKDYKKTKKRLRKAPHNEGLLKSLALLDLMVKEPDLTADDLSEMNVPTLVLVGSNDVIDPSHTKFIADSLPDSRLCVVKGGHSIVKTNSVDYNAALEEFFSERNI